jgi:hypothetical protein
MKYAPRIAVSDDSFNDHSVVSDARLSNGYNSAGADVKGSISATDASLDAAKSIYVPVARTEPVSRR